MSETVIKNVMKEIKEAYPINSIDYTNLTKEKEEKLQQQIDAKIKSGAKLTPEEISYLEKTNPSLYMHIKRVQNMREALVQSLKSCKSKQAAEKVYSEAVGAIGKNDPDKEYILSCYQKAMQEFKASGAYSSLPEKTQEEEKEEEKEKRKYKSEGETTKEEDFNLLSYLCPEPEFEVQR